MTTTINRILTTGTDRVAALNAAALVLRLTLALVLFPHGAQKLLGWFGGPGITGTIGFLNGVYHLPVFLVIIVIVVESVGMVMLALGLATRPIAALTIILMVGAIFIGGHQQFFFMNWFGNQSIEGFEYHLLVIGLATAILITGGGKWAADVRLFRKLRQVAPLCILLLFTDCQNNEDAAAVDPLAENKKLVTQFYDQVFVQKNPAKVDEYIGQTYRQHNPQLPDGKEALKGFLQYWFGTYPSLQIKIERVIAEGDLVVLHVSSRESPDSPPTAITDIFRVSNGRIVEHWDAIQPVPPNPVHNNGMFAGPDNKVKLNSDLEANKQLVRQLYEGVFNGKDLSLIDQYLPENYRQHNPTVADGREGFRQFASFLTTTYPQMRVDIKRVVAENDFVVLHVHAKFSPEDSGSAITDYYRIEAGKIVEHWDVIQPVATDPVNDNTMF